MSIGVVAVGIGLAAADFHGLDTVRLSSVDARFAARGAQGPRNDIVLVGIDDASLEQLERWPFSRTLHARMLRRLAAAGARLVVYDVDFDRPSNDAADIALYDAAGVAKPVVFGTAGIRADGTTQVLGGDQNLRSIGARAAAGLFPRDADGVVRHYAAEIKHLPSVTSAVAGHPSSGWIDVRGPGGTFTTLSFVDVLRGQFDPSSLRGKIVVVGATAPVIHDEHRTAVDAALSGAELQANAIDTALRGSPLGDAPGWQGLLAVVVLALVAPLAGMRVGIAGIAGIGAAVSIVWLALAQIAFDSGTVLDVVSPLLALAVGLVGTGGRQAIADGRERATLRREFAAFHPLLVDQVLTGDARALVGPEDIIGGYRLEEIIGQGGMGVVYRARQLTLERNEAVKLISEAYAANPSYRERFVRESRLAARIEHPHVVPIYNAGGDRGLLYIAMRLIDGVTLSDAVGVHGPLGLRDTVGLIEQLADALNASHALGLIHRDVKPANILITEGTTSHVYLTDFGIAHDTNAQDAQHDGQRVAGSPEYLAPEQLGVGEIGPWTDVYALAGVLVFCLTGAPPFPRHTVSEMLAAHLTAPPPRLSTVRAGLPSGLDRVLLRGLAKAPEDRPATVLEFAAEVIDAAQVASVTPKPLR
ncbi:MAG TPA: serine/threonine-protein kinase [Solirubrobacteraceae bacterium]